MSSSCIISHLATQNTVTNKTLHSRHLCKKSECVTMSGLQPAGDGSRHSTFQYSPLASCSASAHLQSRHKHITHPQLPTSSQSVFSMSFTYFHRTVIFLLFSSVDVRVMHIFSFEARCSLKLYHIRCLSTFFLINLSGK